MSQISTPRGEEAERLDYYYDCADQLCLMALDRQVSEDEYCRRATMLDEEGVGGYFRALCDPTFNLQPRLALHPLLHGVPWVTPSDPPGRPPKPEKPRRRQTRRARVGPGI
jgi:hypothetical protein